VSEDDERATTQADVSAGEWFEANLALIDRVSAIVARKHYVRADAAEDFQADVRVRLMEDDYRVLRQFSGRSHLRTYLTTVIARLLLDRQIHEWGKWRPSARARQLGPLAVRLEQLVWRERHSPDEAIELLRTNHRVDAPERELHILLAELPTRTTTRDVGEEALGTLPGPREAGAERLVLEGEHADLERRCGCALQVALRGLTSEDRLILRLRFEHGRSVADVARRLRLEQKPLYDRIARLLARLRSALEQQGVGAAAVRRMLELADEAPPAAPGPEPVEAGRTPDDGPLTRRVAEVRSGRPSS
jgi:RNA polymerase sigma factor for flagellar operon FliA